MARTCFGVLRACRMERNMKARKKDTPAGGRKNYFLETLLFLAVMVLTLRFCFSGQKPQEIWAAVKSMRGMSLAGAVALGLFFVCMEGTIIRILLGAAGGKSGLLTCISYSFLGFFYSGITPSATGGQSMQLYEMKRDGNSVSSSTVVLMVTAVCYKLVLVCIGTFLLIFQGKMLRQYLGGYFGLYLLGLFLNLAITLVVTGMIVLPQWIIAWADVFDRLFVKLHLWKASGSVGRQEKVRCFVQEYHRAVLFLKEHPGRLAAAFSLTFVQRNSAFVITWLVYCGMGLFGTNLWSVVFLQAAVTLAVDMLPVPGAQGITELVYRSAFAQIFIGGTLPVSMIVSRAASFYVPMAVGLATVLWRMARKAGKSGWKQAA